MLLRMSEDYYTIQGKKRFCKSKLYLSALKEYFVKMVSDRVQESKMYLRF